MMKKGIIVVLCIIVVFGAVSGLHIIRNKNPFDKLDVSDIRQIELSDPVHWVTTESEDDINLIVHTLKGTHLKRIIPMNKDGFAATLNVRVRSGKEISIVVRSEEMMINDACYKTDKDYGDVFQGILRQIEERTNDI